MEEACEDSRLQAYDPKKLSENQYTVSAKDPDQRTVKEFIQHDRAFVTEALSHPAQLAAACQATWALQQVLLRRLKEDGADVEPTPNDVLSEEERTLIGSIDTVMAENGVKSEQMAGILVEARTDISAGYKKAKEHDILWGTSYVTSEDAPPFDGQIDLDPEVEKLGKANKMPKGYGYVALEKDGDLKVEMIRMPGTRDFCDGARKAVENGSSPEERMGILFGYIVGNMARTIMKRPYKESVGEKEALEMASLKGFQSILPATANKSVQEQKVVVENATSDPGNPGDEAPAGNHPAPATAPAETPAEETAGEHTRRPDEARARRKEFERSSADAMSEDDRRMAAANAELAAVSSEREHEPEASEIPAAEPSRGRKDNRNPAERLPPSAAGRKPRGKDYL